MTGIHLHRCIMSDNCSNLLFYAILRDTLNSAGKKSTGKNGELL